MIRRTRSALYATSRILGDLHAIEKGRVPSRVVRKVVYRHAFSFAGWLCRLIGAQK